MLSFEIMVYYFDYDRLTPSPMKSEAE